MNPEPSVKKLSTRHLMLIYMGWWLIWMVLHAFVLYNTGLLTMETSIKDAAITTFVLALSGYMMITSMRYYRPRQLSQLTWSIGLAIGCVFLIQAIAVEVVSNDATYARFVEKSLIVRGLLCWLMISIITIVTWAWFYMEEQQESEKRKVNTEKLAREAELSSLRQQLQPHFLFNSLNSINALIGARPNEARKMVQQLSDFLRGTIRKDDQQYISFREELAHLELYLEIEKVRFGHRLMTVITRKPETDTMVLPSLLLQPLVENAIKFGLYDTIGEITIRLDASAQESYLHIHIENPFDPETSQVKPGTGFGLNSIQRRLYLLYGRSDLLSVAADGSTFVTELKIPQPA
jgi:two-component sensor histidine kinase